MRHDKRAEDGKYRDRYPAEEFQAACGGLCEVNIVANCDHFYNGRENAIQELVCAWLQRTLGAKAAPAAQAAQQQQ